MSAVTAWPQNPVSAPLVNWCGHSGRYYTLRCDDLENFHLTGDGLFVLGAGNIALWVGTAADVIESSERRTAFKAALKICSSVMHYDGSVEDADRLATAWDIENGQRSGQLRLVGAD